MSPRLKIATIFIFLITGIITVRLFQLQVISHGYYHDIAQKEHSGFTELPARRGEILIEDKNSGEVFKLATNTTLNLLYADPYLIENPDLVAKTLTPLIFDLEQEKELDTERMETETDTAYEIEDELTREEALSKIALKTDTELFEDFQDNLKDELGEKTRSQILLAEEVDQETITELTTTDLDGILVTENGDVYAMPPEINDKGDVAKALAEIFQVDAETLESTLEGTNRYIVLKRKLEPEISSQIQDLIDNDPDDNFLGIGMIEEYYRYYPEGELASQVLGYVNYAGVGQYGIEGFFNSSLTGKKGYFTSQIDGTGNQITVGDSVIDPAEDGDNIMLTLDRTIQLEVEKLIQKGVENYQAESGQVIVMDPETGEILAMANYPTYDPNIYGDVYDLTEIELTDEQFQYVYNMGTEEEPTYWLYTHVDPDERIRIFQDEDDPETWYSYENFYGPEVYKNKTIQAIYEPGSVFKPVAMSAAINAGEVTPNSTHYCGGPIQVDEFEIHTFNDEYHGTETMTEVLVHSCNIGMSYVAELLGRSLFASYIEGFGFGTRTDIQLDGEESGYIEYYEDWADSELVTHAFGQGIAVTPLQMITAIAAIANDGVLMQPYVVKYTESSDGTKTEYEPEIIRQVVTKETADTMVAMLTAVIEQGIPTAVLDDHYVAGKSGTAQTYKWGKALTGPGTTITSFIGFGPIDDPQFIILTKLDYPKTSEWCTATAAPVGKEVLDFLYDYYNIPPDK
ncbi:MAG: cell division protein FtsI, stage V sporulation protein D (sporulation-specific penicillin-binding protein) [Candidatus Peregrinibacteria bacterium GW2011_GWF2_43_17]|nr:MAG: cell division protein FtsI, stage V sporulation protein D (sporulation-specific penicillin-binding protein) [Candidatus Peregrinibacteria bacterium GW2011_GWF2_43_17]HAU39537.1 hypothetical protein [Candidatus Peregrinibacteria bacterium]